MRTCTAIIPFVLVALLVGCGPVPVLADEGGDVAAYCAGHGDFGLSHGGCVAYFTSRNLAPHDASVCQEASIRAWLGAENPGQCVKKLREMRD